MSNLKAIKRETATSSSINKLRESGFIPAILYGGKDSNQKISRKSKLNGKRHFRKYDPDRSMPAGNRVGSYFLKCGFPDTFFD